MNQWLIYYGLLALGAALGLIIHAICVMAAAEAPEHKPADHAHIE